MIEAFSNWWDWNKEPLLMIGGIILISALCVGSIFGLDVYGNYRTCERLALIAPGYEFDFSFWGGCWVKTATGYWTSADEYFKRLEIVPSVR